MANPTPDAKRPNHDLVLSIRLREADGKRLTEAAEQCGMKPSPLAREAILDRIDELLGEAPRAADRSHSREALPDAITLADERHYARIAPKNIEALALQRELASIAGSLNGLIALGNKRMLLADENAEDRTLDELVGAIRVLDKLRQQFGGSVAS